MTSNVFILTAIIPNDQLHTTTHILLSNLATVACAVCLFVLPTSALSCFIPHRFIDSYWCRLYGCLFMFLTMATTWTLALITWDKHRTISAPLRYSSRHGKSKELLIKIVTIWVGSFLLSALPLTYYTTIYNFNSAKMYCTINYASHEHRWVSISISSKCVLCTKLYYVLLLC